MEEEAVEVVEVVTLVVPLRREAEEGFDLCSSLWD